MAFFAAGNGSGFSPLNGNEHLLKEAAVLQQYSARVRCAMMQSETGPG